MSNVYFISDLHFGHKNILNFEPKLRPGNTVEEHDAILINNWNSVVTKRDTVYVLGDVCMKAGNLDNFKHLAGRKILIRGNHDTYPLEEYLEHFDNIFGITKYKGYWLSHAPVHPAELRGKNNIHGHVHSQSILTEAGDSLYYDRNTKDLTQDQMKARINFRNRDYINVCCEAIRSTPISFNDIKSGKYWHNVPC